MVTSTPLWVVEFTGRALPEVTETLSLLKLLQEAEPRKFETAFVQAVGGSLLTDFENLEATCIALQRGNPVTAADLMLVAEFSFTAERVLDASNAFMEGCLDRRRVELCVDLQKHGRAMRSLDITFRDAMEGAVWEWQKGVHQQAMENERYREEAALDLV